MHTLHQFSQTLFQFINIFFLHSRNKNSGYAEHKPTLIAGDKTNLTMLTKPFDFLLICVAFIAWMKKGEQKYVSEIYRLLKPGATHLIWTMDGSPNGIKHNHEYIAKVFDGNFKLVKSKPKRRRIVASNWY